MSDLIQHVNDENFETEVISSQTPVIVDFWAEWCGPCKAIAPILDEVAHDYAEKLKIVKLNIDENIETTRKYSVRGIPTLILFKDGNMVDTKVGSMTKPQLTAFIETNL